MSRIYRAIHRNIASIIYRQVAGDVFRHYRWLMESEKWSEQARKEWRLRRLNEMLEYCWDHVPFYREFWGDHGVSRRKLGALEELQDYPILWKKIFRQNAHAIRPDDLEAIRYQNKSTGGSTGEPIHYLQDIEHWAFTQAFHHWGWGQSGYRFGDRVVAIAGGSLVPEYQTLKGKFRSLLERKLFLYGVHMDPLLAKEYVEKIAKFRPEYVYGYPSILSLFASHIREQGLKFPRVNAVICMAEMLLPRYRKNIEDVFGCRVFNHLGSNDGGYMSYECALHKGLHHNDLQSIIETLSNEDKEEGNLLITNLWNKSTPFVRYENGDLISLGDSCCPCGQKFPLIRSVIGQTADILTFSNGRSISGPAVVNIFGQTDVEAWQAVQRERDRIEVLVRSKLLKDSERAHILRVLTHHCGPEVKIDITEVDAFERTRGGKLKPVWSEARD